jgi:hypothetical protein
MEEAPENSKESLHAAHASGIVEVPWYVGNESHGPNNKHDYLFSLCHGTVLASMPLSLSVLIDEACQAESKVAVRRPAKRGVCRWWHWLSGRPSAESGNVSAAGMPG